MPCLVPFGSRNLDISFFVFRPTGVVVEELVEALKWFSFCAEDHGCAYSALFKSIHGNLIIWYGAWIKRSEEKKKLLNASLLSTLTKVSSLAILLDYGFFEPYAGESKDGHSYTKISTGDTVSMTAMSPNSHGVEALSYACLAVLRSIYIKTEGVSSAICFQCNDKPMVATMHVWKSLQSCYTWLLKSDPRKTIAPYVKHLAASVEYDVFRVVFVSNDDIINLRFLSPQEVLGTKEGTKEKQVL
ncbi:hypothetical protein H6P81_019552 [Aristolochia fimbriata]|uniref:DUF7392 domain-containing protein n=1 Tax=Aristolochia fimbriata TaxID=158543 RepID=A0AAV7DS42_ARIFI|nr:hypothetical protein H6P81_019552 [Aristolochia fimbriata]